MEQRSLEQLNKFSSHFWVSSFPFFETSLIVIPSLELLLRSEPSFNLSIECFDCDGGKVNEVSVTLPTDRQSLLELDQFLGSAKLESGIKYAHLIVTSPRGTLHQCRLHSTEAATQLGEARTVSVAGGGFFPLTVAQGRSNLLCAVNKSHDEALLRCRLFFGKRMPEAAWTIPPLGAKVIHIETEFHEYADLEPEQQIQAYLRLSTRQGGVLGVQLIEQCDSTKEHPIFSAVS